MTTSKPESRNPNMLSGVLATNSTSPATRVAALAGPEGQLMYSQLVKPNDSNTPISIPTKFGKAV